MVDAGTATTIVLATLGAVGTGVRWAVKLEQRLTVHEKTDAQAHAQTMLTLDDLKKSGDRQEEKLDRLVERLIPSAR